MTHDIEAVFDHGVFRPLEPLAMAEGTRVRLRVEAENGNTQAAQPAEAQAPNLRERLKNIVGSIEVLP